MDSVTDYIKDLHKSLNDYLDNGGKKTCSSLLSMHHVVVRTDDNAIINKSTYNCSPAHTALILQLFGFCLTLLKLRATNILDFILPQRSLKSFTT